MFKTQRSRTATSNYLDIHLPGGIVVDINQHHDDTSLTVALRDEHETRRVRVTAFKSTSLTFGASLQIADDAEDSFQASVYLGKLALAFSARGRHGRYEYPKPEGQADPETGCLPPPRTPPVEVEPPGLLRRIAKALTPKHGRRKLSATLDYFDTETPEGAELRLRAVLWDDDSEYRVGNLRQPSVSLTHLLWGKPTQGPDEVVEEREVVVALPEGPFKMTAKLMQRVVTWPRWPLRRLYRWVNFSPASMLVPMKGSDRISYEGHGPGCSVGVTGTSYSSAIGELVRRVHRARESYGSRSWAPKPTPHHRESHRVAFSWEKPARGQDSTAGGADLFHGDVIVIGQAAGAISMTFDVERRIHPPLIVASLERDPADGGVILTPRMHITRADIAVDGVLITEPRKIWPYSTVRIGGLRLVAHFDPIGPPAPLQQMELANVPASPDEVVASDVAEVTAGLDTSPPSADEVVVPRPEDYELPADEERPVEVAPEPDPVGEEAPIRLADPAAPIGGWQGD